MARTEQATVLTYRLGSALLVAFRGDEEKDQAEAEEGTHRGAHGRADGALELGRDALGMARAEVGEIDPDPGEQQLGKGDPDHCARFLRHGGTPPDFRGRYSMSGASEAVLSVSGDRCADLLLSLDC